MATTGKVAGKLIKVWIDDDPESLGGSGNKLLAGCQTDFNLNRSTSSLEANCKDDGNFSDAVPDKNSSSFDLGLLMKFDADFNYAELVAISDNQTICEVTMSTGEVGDPEDVAIAFMTELGESAPVEGIAEISTSWQCKGQITHGTVSA